MAATKTAALKPVHFIYGEHRLLLKEALDRLSAAVAGGDPGGLDVCRFNSSDNAAAEIVAACQALSFFGGRRLVVVNDALTLNETDQAVLADYVKDPNPETILVLTHVLDSNAKAARRRLTDSRLYKACDAEDGAAATEYKLTSFHKHGLPGWVRAVFAARGKRVGAAAIDYLLTWTGTDLSRLKNEIEKISDSTDEEEVDLEQVKRVAVATHEAGVFDLVNAVVARDTETALARLAALIEADATGGGLFGLLERQFNLILTAKTKGRGLKGQSLAASLGISTGRAFHLERQGRLFSLEAVKKSLGLLVVADHTRKSSPIPVRLLLETLIIDLCEV